MAVAAFPAPPFVASPNSQLKSGVAIRPSYNVTSLAELDNSPWLVAADGKGRLSVWNLGPDMDVDTPDFVLQAHSSAIHAVVALQSGRLQEVIEELHWPAGAHGIPRKVVLRASPPREDMESVSTAASEHRPGSGTLSPGPRQLGEAEPSPAPPSVEAGSGSSNTGELEEAGPRNRGAAAFLRRLCCCLCNKADGTPRSWRRRKFRRVQKQHWLVATAGEDGWIKVWRLRPREDQKPDVDPLQADFITEWSSKAHAPVTSLLELHDGLLVVSLAGSPDVRILDPVTAQVKSVLFGHVGQVLCLAACADGRLVTGGADGSVRLWAKRMWSSEEGGEKKAPETTMDAAGEGYPSLVGVATLPARKPTPPPSSLPPMIPALGWAEEDQKEASAGVSNTAFFAHMQQADKGESCNLALRVYVHSAEGLPRAGLVQPYVHCYVQEGVEHIPSIVTSARTSSQPGASWNERCKLVLRRGLVEGEWQLPECSWLTCQLFLESKSRKKPLLLLGHWSEKLQLILQELARSPSEAAQPKPRKLYAPPGEGPYMELQASVLHVGFEQTSSDCLECVIASADGLPQDMQGSLFVRMHINQSMPGRTRRVPPMHQERTRVAHSSDPCFDEVLTLDVPVHLCDQRLNLGADLHLHVEVYDAASLASEDLLGTMSLPLDAVLKRDGEEPKQYNLTIAPGAILPPAGKRKGTDIAPASKLILGFQALMPCPMQLRCVVDHGNGLPTANSFHASPNRDTFLPMVRMSFVEGNPLPAQATVTRTMTWRHTMKKGEEPQVSPVWDEQLFLPLPSWIWDVSLSKAAPDRERPSVREGWEHADSHTLRGAVVCADLYDCDALGVEKFLGRAVVPFDHAYRAASSGSGSKPRAVSLTCLPDSYLWMGFELGGDNDHFVVALARAEDLPVDPVRQEVAISCVVRITELGAFGRPTDKADLVGSVATATTFAAEEGHPGKLVWQHEEILELPGAAVKSSVAARPNWYLQFEVLDSDPRAVDAPPLAVAAAPLSDVLNQSWEVQAPEQKSSVLQKRIANMRAPLMPPKSKVAAAPGTNMAATEPIVRELPVLLRRTGLEARDQPQSPGRSWKEEFKQRTRSLTQLLTGKSEETLLEAAPVEEVVDDGVHNDDRILIVQFEVLSRWQGTGGGAKCAPTRPMHGPSPVRSLVPLVSSVVAGHENGNIFVWDVTGCSAIPLHQFQAHKVSISCMLHMPAMDCLITAAMPMSREEQVSESLLRVWSSSTLDLRQTVPLHGSGKCLALLRANEKGSVMLALGKETRQSCQLQLYHLDAA